MGIGWYVQTNADGIIGIGSTGCAFITEGHFGDASAFAKASIEGEGAFTEGFDSFVDGADDESCWYGAELFAAWGESVSDEQNVGADFEWNEVIGRIEASRRVVVPVVVVFVGVVLILGEASLHGVQIERRFADDCENRATSLTLPKQRSDSERTDRNDVHGGGIVVEGLGEGYGVVAKVNGALIARRLSGVHVRTTRCTFAPVQ